MDWNNLTPIQLMALGAKETMCEASEDSCKDCWVYTQGKKPLNLYCNEWAVGNPEEVLKLYGVDVSQTEDGGAVDLGRQLDRLINSTGKLRKTVNRLQKENADQIAATAEALSAKEALEVDLDELKVLCAQLQEENADLLKDRDSEDLELERVRNGNKDLSANNRKLSDDLSTMTRAYCEEKGRADGILEALKIVSGSQT